jgi:hypothetical protein
MTKEPEIPLEDLIPLLAQEVEFYKQMLVSPGFGNLEKEIDLYVANCFEYLASCKPEDVRETQGKIAALRWLRALPDEAALKLEGFQQQLRDKPTE